MITTVDADFLALPLEKVSAAALNAATSAGASHADVRIERTRTGVLSLRDAKPETQADETNFGIGVRVIVNGAWGFASSPDVSVESAQKLAATAVAMAKTSKPLSTDEISLVPEPVYAKKSWVSAYEIDPFAVSDSDKKDRLASLSSKLLAAKGVNHTSAQTMFVKEQKHYADSAGTSTTQQRVRIQSEIEAISIGDHGFESMRTLAQPAGYGMPRLSSYQHCLPKRLQRLR
jgi:TldD protein